MRSGFRFSLFIFKAHASLIFALSTYMNHRFSSFYEINYGL